MGCFNVSCSVSSISMYVDDAVLIPLKSVAYPYCGANICSDMGLKTLFQPLTLPIFGNLDSYGRLENIQKDANTDCIEKYFGIGIDEFAEYVAVGEKFVNSDLGWKKHEHKLLTDIYGMWVHREIWDFLSSKSVNESGRPDYFVHDDGQLIVEVLNLLGFKFINQDTERGRYDTLFKRDELPQVEIYSDGRWIRVNFKGKNVSESESVYNVSDLINLIEKETDFKFPEEETKKLKTITFYDVCAIRALQSLEKEENSLQSLESISTGLSPELSAELRELRKFHKRTTSDQYNIFSLQDRFAGNDIFMDIYGDRIKDIIPLLIKHKHFERAMLNVNRLYMPSYNGRQHGNHHMSALLFQKSLDIVKNNIEKQEE